METNRTGKEFSIFTVLDTLRRRKLYILVPALLLMVGFTLYAFYLPELYRSKALLAAEPAVAPDYLRPTAPINIQEQLRTIREILFSRSVLEGVAKEMRLDGGAEGKVPESAIEGLKSKIKIEVEGEDAFYIAFEGEDRYRVANVTNRLAELFIERALAVREKRAHEAAGVIESELERLRRRLAEQDEKIKQYKQRAIHELPEHMATNLRLIEMLQDQIQAKTELIANDEARRAALLEEMRQLEQQGALERRENKEKTVAEQRLEELRLKLKQLQASYTERHPEIARVEKEIKDLERITAASKKSRGEPSPLYMRYLQLKAELEAVERRINSYKQESRALAAQMSGYRRRIEAAPQHEKALAELTRDYQTTQEQYLALLAKQHEAKLAERLEKMNKGVVFKIVEPAALPLAPFTPHRERIILLGLFAGLGLGLIVAFFAEQMDTSFDNIEDFQSFTKLPVLAIIPSISSSLDQSKNGQKPRLGKISGIKEPQ